MVARPGERRRGCGLTGVCLREARDGNKVRRASPGLCGNWGKFEGGARWLHEQESVAWVVG